MKALDLTNQRFGRLVALYKCNYKKGKRYPWHCICDCGNECDVLTNPLRTGHTQSCGCLQKEKASEIGKRTVYTAMQAVRDSIDLIGERFGALTVIDNVTNHGKNRWKCKCDCGSIIYTDTNHLRSGNTKSCGCIKSHGQRAIALILTENNISFETEKAFDNCRNVETNYPYKFDFYVNNQYIIEYDGVQHFKHNSFFSMSLEEVQTRDLYKNEFCKQQKIPLIRIPYTHLEQLNIKDLLLESSEFIIK